MCEIFPEVSKCCVIVPVRIGLIYIAVLAIVTGSLAQCILTKSKMFDFDTFAEILARIKPENLKNGKDMAILWNMGISAVAVLFIILGLLLLVANLLDAEQMVLLFVWGVAVGVLVSFVLTLLVVAECMLYDVCLLSHMDWFSGSVIIVGVIFYQVLWLYFAAVANTYSSGLV